MSQLFGYHGCYLRIDLSSGETTRVVLDPSTLRQCIGGSGLGVHILHKENSATVEPFSAEAALAFVFSPLVGSPLTTSAKFAVVSKSPLTQRINDSLASSTFALAGKRCGCDAIVLVGTAKEPSIVVIDNGKVTLLPADTLWGQEIPTVEAELRKRLGNDFSSAVIGPAGERLVRYATISHDGRHAGRGGSGAVLGSKNIKAISVRGEQRVDWAEPEELSKFAKQLSEKSFGPATEKYRELGTASNLLVFNRLAALPTKNFQHGSFEGVEALSPSTLNVTREKTRQSCACCTIGCEHIYAITANDSKMSNGKKAARDRREQGTSVRVEYENLFALGPLCCVSDPEIVLRASERCDALGLDTISTGGTIAFAMECAERGLIDESWLKFGDGDALLRTIDLISRRENIGDLLAEGSRIAAQKIGNGAGDFAPHVKGLEMPGYDPRALQSMGLGFAVATRGADHNRSGAYQVDFSEHVDRRNILAKDVFRAIETENQATILDSAILCKFLRGALEDIFADSATMLKLVTGWDYSAEELQQSANAIVRAKKHFNILAGWQPEEDRLPKRILEQALPEDDRAKLTEERLLELIKAYNLGRGWTEEGWLE